MRLEWIDDILAVLDCGSLAQAAEKRLLTQSAFTRRVRTIEDSIGATLFDRRRKPVSLMPGVETLEPELRELSARVHQLRHSLKSASKGSSKPLTFICQHALTSTIAPRVVRAATKGDKTAVRVRSGNQDECLMLLLSKTVDLAIMYRLPDDPQNNISSAFETVGLGDDILVPVCTPLMRSQAMDLTIPIIAYPPDVFLGQVFARMIAPQLSHKISTTTIAETALTLAMLQLVLNDIGIAWLPLSLIAKPLAQGDLVRLDDILPTQRLNITMVRMRGIQTQQSETIWQKLSVALQTSAPQSARPEFLCLRLFGGEYTPA